MSSLAQFSTCLPHLSPSPRAASGRRGKDGTVATPSPWPIRVGGPSALRVVIAGRSLPGACSECLGPAGPQPGQPGRSKDPLAAFSPERSATCWMPRNPAQPVPVWGLKSQMWKLKTGLHSQAVLRTGSLALGRCRRCLLCAAVLDGGWGEGQLPPSACSSGRSLRLWHPTVPPSEASLHLAASPCSAWAQSCPTLSDPMEPARFLCP